jgi:hypothetical protein
VLLDGYAYYRTVMHVPAIPKDGQGFGARLKACEDAIPPSLDYLDPDAEWAIYEFEPSAHYGGTHEADAEGGWRVTVVARVSVCRPVQVLADDEREAYDEAYRFLDGLAFSWPETLGSWTVETRCGIEACEAEEAESMPTTVRTGR